MTRNPSDSESGSPGDRPDRIAVLLLAAGSSTRMGNNKMLMKIDGETILRRAAKTAIATGFDPVMVVTGHERQAAEAEIDGLACDSVFNPDHDVGIHTSVRAGIDALPENAVAVVIMLADMPFVTTAMLTDLQRCYRESEAPLVISRYGGEVKAPPMLYDRTLFPELRVMQRRCGREVVKRHLDEAMACEWPIEALADVDTPEDYERVCATIAEGAGGA
jgi:molybdenum cofactor cytidylyltransferase